MTNEERAMSLKKGKAGELLVATELLRRGYDVYLPLVDTGIDLVCLPREYDREALRIQVKVSRQYRNNRFWIKMNVKTLDEACIDVFVFVLMEEARVNYLVVPSRFLVDHRDEFSISDTGMVNLYFEFDAQGRVIETRKSQLNVSQYLHNFDIKGL